VTPQFTLGLTSIAGYGAVIQVSCQGLPSDASCNLGINPVDLPAGGQSLQSFNISASSAMKPGTYPFQVVATDGILTQSYDVSFEVVDFALTATPAAFSTLPTATTSFAVVSSSEIGTGQAIAMTCTTSSPAVQCQLPGPTLGVGLGEQVNVVTQNAASGTYTVTVTGQIGTLVHSATVQVNVGSVDVSISPPSGNIAVGSSASFSVTLQSRGGFAGSFDLSCSSDVGSVICSAYPSPTTVPANGSGAATLSVTVLSKTNLQPLPAIRNSTRSPWREVPGVLAALVAILFLTALVAFVKFPERTLVHEPARIVLLLTLATALGSCGGGGGVSGGGGGGGGGGTAQVIHVKVQATAGGLTVPVGTITVTVP